MIRNDSHRFSKTPIVAGSVQNGPVMLFWYQFLNRVVGSTGATGIVLTKAALDQAFFATQADGIFLALCAYQSKHELQGYLFTPEWLISRHPFV